MSHHKRLVLLCIRGLSKFQPHLKGIDEYLESFLQSDECKSLDEADKIFISEVLAGCTRYDKLIKVVVDGFYVTDGKTFLKADYSLFKVIAYLVMFRLEELGVSHFRRFINSQDNIKMYKFLNFLYDEANLKMWIMNEWFKVYERTFVQTNIISPMLRYQDEMLEVIHQLKDKVENKSQRKKSSKASFTDPKPFSLTKPRPRAVPTPEKIPLLKVFKPVPKSTYSGPAEREAVEKMRSISKQKAEERLLEAERLKFSCATVEKSEKTKNAIKKIIREREEKEMFEPLKPAPVPSNIHEDVPIKFNAAAILREGARIQKEEEEVLKRLAGLEAGGKDDSEFLLWQEEMKQKEAAETLAEIERKHLAGQMSYEEAIIARQSCFQEAREKVKVIKEEKEQIMNAYFAEREEQRKEMRQLVETISENRENVKEAKDKLQKMKQRIVQQVAQESREQMRQALEEAEEEMRRKTELIRQIRAMESVPIIRHKFVDPTETSGHGLLSEMSIAELHERIALLKISAQEEEERKRKDITAAKEAKSQMLSEALENISKYRKEKTKSATESNIQRKESMAKMLADQRDKKLVSLQEQLEQRRRVRERLVQENPLSRAQQQQMQSKKENVGWNKLQSIRSTSQLKTSTKPQTLTSSLL